MSAANRTQLGESMAGTPGPAALRSGSSLRRETLGRRSTVLATPSIVSRRMPQSGHAPHMSDVTPRLPSVPKTLIDGSRPSAGRNPLGTSSTFNRKVSTPGIPTSMNSAVGSKVKPSRQVSAGRVSTASRQTRDSDLEALSLMPSLEMAS